MIDEGGKQTLLFVLDKKEMHAESVSFLERACFYGPLIIHSPADISAAAESKTVTCYG